MNTVVGYDLETTGTDPETCSVVQIGALLDTYDGDRLTHSCPIMNTLARPTEPIPEEASQVHGITNEAVRYAPLSGWAVWTLVKMFNGLREFYGSDLILTGYNIRSYDNKVVYYSSGGWEFPSDLKMLDILDLLFRQYPELESHKLGAAYQALTGEELTGAHGALQDCLGSSKLLEIVCQELRASPEELVEWMSTPQVYSKLPIGKHKGAPVQSVPRSWAQWMRNNARQMRPDLKRTVDWILDERR